MNATDPAPAPQPGTPPPPLGARPPSSGPSTGGLSASQWAMFLHLSQFLGYLLPGLGFAGPIIIWILYKESLPGLDAHGKVVVNWLISFLVYSLAAGLLAVVSMAAAFFLPTMFVNFALPVLAVPLFGLLTLAGVVFPIIGAVKANSGEVWRYPLSIRFIK